MINEVERRVDEMEVKEEVVKKMMEEMREVDMTKKEFFLHLPLPIIDI